MSPLCSVRSLGGSIAPGVPRGLFRSRNNGWRVLTTRRTAAHIPKKDPCEQAVRMISRHQQSTSDHRKDHYVCSGCCVSCGDDRRCSACRCRRHSAVRRCWHHRVSCRYRCRGRMHGPYRAKGVRAGCVTSRRARFGDAPRAHVSTRRAATLLKTHGPRTRPLRPSAQSARGGGGAFGALCCRGYSRLRDRADSARLICTAP